MGLSKSCGGAPAIAGDWAAHDQRMVEEAVIDYFTNHGSEHEEGAHIDDAVGYLGANGLHDEQAVRRAIALLEAEGHIYSTIDYEHFKATN